MTAPPLVDPLTGIVRRLVDVAPVPGVPRRYRAVTAEVADARRLGGWPADRVSLGTAFGDVDAARAAAVGEAVERYCGNRVPPGLRTATAAELAAAGERHFGPTDLPFFTPRQYGAEGFPYRPFTDDLPITWVAGRESGETCLLPASWVYLNYHSGARRAQPRLHHLNYAGIATGVSAEDAFTRALLELVERDALERWWHLGAPTTGISVADVPGLAAELAGCPLEVHLVELPTEHPVSCVGAVVVDHANGIVAGGGAARFDPVEACGKAVLEAIHTWVFTQGLLDADGWVFQAVEAGLLARGLYLPHRADRRYRDDVGVDYAAVRDLGAQVQVWLDPRVQGELLHRFTRPERVVEPQPGGDLAALLESLAGNRIATVDLTTEDVAEAGLHVVRVCATGLVPNAPAAFRYLGLPRWGDPGSALLDPPPFL
ncbi:YcaO-like family protein [Saccharothrix obliqua]|uniref:YcaO-like family protein n=1 Tax=Saccharothrix obliqua TaxID=2861747 RepID=UPI001C5E501D|nr:YcaO-like family protein [Saccharothrix obliqua]MBW4717776.1 YcaO-like family protein [Saccharothrix obliqua]